MSIESMLNGLLAPDRMQILKALGVLESQGFLRFLEKAAEEEVLSAAMVLANSPEELNHMRLTAIKAFVLGTLVSEIQGVIRNNNENREG